ncbi:MAG: prepilin-type N-terminal cleavage/methylation domain-containing protein [Candidatus Aminicenantia bacterium]
MKNESGQSLVELLIAMGIFVLVVSAITFLILDVYLADRAGRERMLAIFFAQEGIEAVHSMRDGDFDNLTLGTHGIALSGNKWIFSGNFDSKNQFIRQIIISDVPGDIDVTDIKKVESKVVWNITPARQTSVILIDYLTDWKQTQGEAEELDVSVEGAELRAGQRYLRGITIENIGVSNIAVDKMTVSWNNSNLIEEIKIDGTKVWSKNGPGTPTGSQPSGTELDIQDFTLESFGAEDIDKFKFDGNMSGTAFYILFRMIDNSTKYVFVEAL